MDDANSKMELTTKESFSLLGLCLAIGVAYGFILSYLHGTSVVFGIVLFLCLGPGTWFWAFGRFGNGGRRRSAFIRNAIGLFNLLGSFISFLTAGLIYVLR
jgi:hypothetical protein